MNYKYPTVGSFWDHSSGWIVRIIVANARHFEYVVIKSSSRMSVGKYLTAGSPGLFYGAYGYTQTCPLTFNKK